MHPVHIFIGSDYRGFERKKELISALTAKHAFLTITDKGTFNSTPDDYNDSAIAVSQAVLAQAGSFGILICSSAHGMCIQANRFKGIRAINASTPSSAQLGREHENANILCLSADTLDLPTTLDIAKSFFHTHFDDKNTRRINRIKRLDERNYD